MYSDVKTTFDPDMGWCIETTKLLPSNIHDDDILGYFDGRLFNGKVANGDSLLKKTAECNMSYAIHIGDFNVCSIGSYLPNGEQSLVQLCHDATDEDAVNINKK